MKLVFLFLLLLIVLISGCASANETKRNTQDQTNEPILQSENTAVAADLENKLTEKPWRSSSSYGSASSFGRTRLILKKGLFGNTWEYGSKTSFSTGNWELKDLTEKDLKDLSNGGYSKSDVSSKKIVLHRWHENGKAEDAESLIFLDKGEPWQLAPPTGYFIKDQNAETNELA